MEENTNFNEEFISWFKETEHRENFVKKLNYLNVPKKNSFISVKSEKYSYLPDKDFLEWLKVVLNLECFADVRSYKGLLDYRDGQYSNATLYSSSRLALELCRQDTFIESFIAKCFSEFENSTLKRNVNYKVHLEYLLPFKVPDNGGEKVPTNSHMDVFIELYNKNVLSAVLAIEFKMKEIYKIENNSFTKSYEGFLDKLCCKSNSFEKDGTELKYSKQTRLYYKQQACHLIGLNQFKENNPNVVVKFANFVFSPEGFDFDKNIENAYKEYVKDARKDGIVKELIDAYGFNNIEYCGVFSQEVDDKCVKAKFVE